MIWEKSLRVILMLTPLEENRRIKCYQYWPPTEGSEREYGEFKVKLVSEKTTPEKITVRRLTLSDKSSPTTRSITQFQYVDWPDHGSPETTALFLNLVKVVNEETKQKEQLTVHCRFEF